MKMKSPAEQMKVVNQFSPKDINGAAQGGNYNHVSLRNYQGCFAEVQVGAHSGAATAVTIKQAKNVEGNGNKALSFDRYYKQAVAASPQQESDMWVEVTGASGTFNIAANHNYIIPIRPAMLDVTNDFDCVRVEVAAAGASTIAASQLTLHGGPEGITGNTDHIPSAKVNQMPN